MSPEMLQGSPHGLLVDYYSLGALLFELVTGLPPFYSANRQEMYKKILGGQLEFPPNLSWEICSLIRQLLIKSPERRLGAQRGVAEIKEHIFLRDIDWNRVLLKTIPPPIVPSLRESNFDSEFRALPVRLSEEDEGEIPNFGHFRERTLSEPNLKEIAIKASSSNCNLLRPPLVLTKSAQNLVSPDKRRQPSKQHSHLTLSQDLKLPSKATEH